MSETCRLNAGQRHGNRGFNSNSAREVLDMMKKVLLITLIGTALAVTSAAVGMSMARPVLKPGDILLTDKWSILKIDPVTREKSNLSFLCCNYNYGIAVDSKGEIYTTSILGLAGTVLQIDPSTGNQTIISQGGYLSIPKGIAIDSTGQLLVTDDAGLIKIDPASGIQTLLASSPIDPAGYGVEPWGIAIVPGGPKK
jgi:DNA-binding beta-propeller fold protein YncE